MQSLSDNNVEMTIDKLNILDIFLFSIRKRLLRICILNNYVQEKAYLMVAIKMYKYHSLLRVKIAHCFILSHFSPKRLFWKFDHVTIVKLFIKDFSIIHPYGILSSD
jgi:hypothetical protein